MFPVIPEPIKQLILAMHVEPDMVIADFGAGAGFVAIELAKKVGQAGLVYAIDIMENPLEVVRTNASTYHLFNIKTILSDLEQPKGSTLASESCDWVVISNILFQVPDQKAILKEAKRILKPHGKIAVVEWKPDMMPSQNHTALSKETVQAMFEELACKRTATFEPDGAHYGMLFQK